MNRMMLIFICLGALLQVGCVGHRVDVLKEGVIQLHESIPPGLSVNTDVFADEGNLVVIGRMSRGPLDLRPIFGHIDITVTTPTGDEIATVKASFRKLPTWRHGPHPMAFRAEFPGVPPPNSLVEVTYHAERHD